MYEKKQAMFNGKKVTEEEYWKLRMEEIIRNGCKKEDMYDLKTDLDCADFNDLEQDAEECINLTFSKNDVGVLFDAVESHYDNQKTTLEYCETDEERNEAKLWVNSLERILAIIRDTLA